MITLMILILISLLLSGLFSGSEMAYLSCNKLKFRHMADEGDKKASLVMRFQKNPQSFLTTVLIGNNFAHIAMTALATYLFENRFGISDEWVVTLILAPFIIIFAETIPKDWFRLKADDFIYAVSPVLHFIERVMSGPTKALVMTMDVLVNFAGSGVKRSPFVTRDEFRYVIEESSKKGVIHQHERQMINIILNLRTLRSEEIMIPLAKFPKVTITSRISDVKLIARKTNADAVLVYEEIPSIVVGIIYIFDVLFEEDEHKPLSRYLKSPHFIEHDTSTERALFLLQSRRASYAVVINDLREVIGMVSVENLIRI